VAGSARQTQVHDIVGLLRKAPVIAQLERTHPVRLQIASPPDPADGGSAHFHLLGQAPCTPMRGVRRSFLNRLADDLLDLFGQDHARPSRSGRVLQSWDPLLPKAPFPPRPRLPRDPQLRGNLLLGHTRCQPEDDLGPLQRSRRQRPTAGATIQFVLLSRGQLHVCGARHAV